MPYEVWYTKIVTPTIRQENPRGHECSALSQLPSMRTPDTYFCPHYHPLLIYCWGDYRRCTSAFWSVKPFTMLQFDPIWFWPLSVVYFIHTYIPNYKQMNFW